MGQRFQQVRYAAVGLRNSGEVRLIPVSSRTQCEPAPQQLYDAFLRSLQRGESVDFAGLCAEHPHLADELRQLHGDQDTVQQQRQSSVVSGTLEAAAVVAPTPPVGRYGQRHRLARGGMGVIYKVWDTLLHRHLAMKIVRQQDAPQESHAPTDPQVLARFVREAEITARLDHPGVVPIHDLGIDENGRIFFTMRLVQGKSLAWVMEQARQQLDKWTQTRVVDVIIKVCETVAFAHSRGVIHRDLKPDNIMVGAFGETYVMDWGLAKLALQPASDVTADDQFAEGAPTIALGESGEPSTGSDRSGSASGGPAYASPAAGSSGAETEVGCVLGTVWYMPLEQASGRIDELDERSDIYSVGAILYELLCGQRPYAVAGKTMKFDEVVETVLAGPPRPIADLNSRVPAELAAICEKAMARDKRDRYQNMREMAEDLRAYVEHRVVRAYQTGAWAELKKWVKRNRGLAIASVLVLLVSLSGLVGVVGVQSWANVRLSEANDDILSANRKIVEESKQKQEALKQQTVAREAAEEQRRRAEGLYLARQAADVVEKNPGQALLLALESHDRHASFEANSALLAALASHHELRTMYGHDGPIRAASVSADRKRLVTAAEDKTAVVWDIASGQPTARLIGHGDWIRHAEFHPDGQRVITASDDHTAAIWDANTGERLRVLSEHGGIVGQVAVSADGALIATACYDGVVRLWDANSGAKLGSLVGHGARVYRVAFSPDSKQLASGSADKTVRIWDVEQGIEQASLTGFDGGISYVAFNPAGSEVFAVASNSSTLLNESGQPIDVPSRDRAIHVFDARSGQHKFDLSHPAAVESIALSHDGERLAAGLADGLLRVWNLSTATIERDFRCLDGGLGCVEFSEDDQHIAGGSQSGTVWICSPAAREPLQRLGGHTASVTHLSFLSADRVISASRDRTVRVWNRLPPCYVEPPASGEFRAAAVRFDAAGKRCLIFYYPSRLVRVFDLASMSEIASLEPGDTVEDAHLTSDGNGAAVLTVSGNVYVWSPLHDANRQTLEGTGRAAEIRFMDGDQLLVRSTHDRLVTAWSCAKGVLLHRLEIPNAGSILLAPNGTVLSWRPSEHDFDVQSLAGGGPRRLSSVLDNSESAFPNVQISPTGDTLVTYLPLGPPPKLWNLDTNRFVAALGDEGSASLVAFSSEGDAIVTVSLNSAVTVFDAVTGRMRSKLAGVEASIQDIVVGPRADRIVTRSLSTSGLVFGTANVDSRSRALAQTTNSSPWPNSAKTVRCC